MINRKKQRAGQMLLLAMSVLSGCTPKIDEERKAIVDDFSEQILPYDADYEQFDLALEKLGDYVEGAVKQEAMIEILQSSLEELEQNRDQLQPYTLDASFQTCLEISEISSEDYLQSLNSRADSLDGLTEYLSIFLEQVEAVDTDSPAYSIQHEMLDMEYEVFSEILQADKEYFYYYNINRLFRNWDKAGTAYLRRTVLEKLKSLDTANYTWETDAEKINEHIMTCQDDLENGNEEWAERLADLQDAYSEALEDEQETVG